MSDHSVLHHTFSIERSYPHPVSKVFAAWLNPEAKQSWFAGGDVDYELDFRVGGLETNHSRIEAGRVITFQSRYLDIRNDQQVIYTSTLSDGSRLSTASITTVEFRADGAGTTLVLTESDVFLDGQEEPAWREQGTSDWLTKLQEHLQGVRP